MAHTIGQLIPLYTTTKSRILLSTLLDEVIRKYKERILKLIINAFDVQSRSICKVHPQYVKMFLVFGDEVWIFILVEMHEFKRIMGFYICRELL